MYTQFITLSTKKIYLKSKCTEAQRHHETLAIEQTSRPAANIMTCEAAIRKQAAL